MGYETKHLLKKLKIRDPKKFREIKSIKDFDPHQIFKIVTGGIEEWEIVIVE